MDQIILKVAPLKLIEVLEAAKNDFQFSKKIYVYSLHSDLDRSILSGNFFSLDQTQG